MHRSVGHARVPRELGLIKTKAHHKRIDCRSNRQWRGADARRAASAARRGHLLARRGRWGRAAAGRGRRHGVPARPLPADSLALARNARCCECAPRMLNLLIPIGHLHTPITIYCDLHHTTFGTILPFYHSHYQSPSARFCYQYLVPTCSQYMNRYLIEVIIDSTVHISSVILNYVCITVYIVVYIKCNKPQINLKRNTHASAMDLFFTTISIYKQTQLQTIWHIFCEFSSYKFYQEDRIEMRNSQINK